MTKRIDEALASIGSALGDLHDSITDLQDAYEHADNRDRQTARQAFVNLRQAVARFLAIIDHTIN